MPIKPQGKVIVGEDAREKITKDILTKSDLSKKELEFVLIKLQDANYKGIEFELFYTCWVKLTEKLKKLS